MQHERRDSLQAIYAKLPRLKCRGKCSISCGPIGMSDAEEQRLAENGVRVDITHHRINGPATCNQLTDDRRCAIYEMRPLICRLWGMVEFMKCKHGCVPSGGFLTNTEARALLIEAEEI